MSEEQKPVAWVGQNPRDGSIELCQFKPAPSVLLDFNMKPLYANPTPDATDTPTRHEPCNCKRIKWDASAPITLNDGRIGVGTFSAPAVVAQLVEALDATKAWLDAEENHELEPDFWNRAHMARMAQNLVNAALAAAKEAGL